MLRSKWGLLNRKKNNKIMNIKYKALSYLKNICQK